MKKSFLNIVSVFILLICLVFILTGCSSNKEIGRAHV